MRNSTRNSAWTNSLHIVYK
nr:unnamed protein product [Callosobruchus chinensis]